MQKLSTHLEPTPANLTLPTTPEVNEHRLRFNAEWIASYASHRNDRRDCHNPKPNEDWVVVDPDRGLVVIADGITRTKPTTGVYPTPSPSALAARLFCETVQATFRNVPKVDDIQTLRLVVAEANRALAQFNLQHFPDHDFAERDRAGVAAVIGVVEGQRLWNASIADCWIYGCGQSTSVPIAREKTSHARPEYERLGEVEARRNLRNRVGHPSAYGAFTGEPAALNFVEYSSVALEDIRRVVFASDGLLRIVHDDPSSLTHLSASSMIRYGLMLDATYHETDDKTVVILDREST